MGITVKDLIDRYSAINESGSDTSSDSTYDVKLSGSVSALTESEQKMFAALCMGVVTEKVIKSRRESR